jgi:hypothetical protein
VKKIMARYPKGREHSAIMPLLDLAQRQVGAETQHAGLAADPGDRISSRQARCGMPYIRALEVVDLLHDVQPGAGRPLSCAGLRHDAVHAARLGRRVRWPAKKAA